MSARPASARARRRDLALAAVAAPGAAVFVLFFVAPLIVVMVEALGGRFEGFSRLFARSEFWPGLRNTLLLGLTAGVLSTAVGAAVAWHLSRMADARRTALLFLIALPLTFSGLVVAFGFILAFGRAGFFTLGVSPFLGLDPVWVSGFIYSPQGLAFVYSYYLIPRVVLMLLPVFVNFDQAQLAAAESLGASRRRAIVEILLPQAAPAMIAAFCLVVAVALGAYGTALALVGTQVNILPLQLFTLVSDSNSHHREVAALALLLTALCSLVMATGEWLAARDERASH